LLRAGGPSFWQPALAPEPFGFPSFHHQIAAQLPRLEPLRQDKLANPRRRHAEHPRDLCCGQRINVSNAKPGRPVCGANSTFAINYHESVIVVSRTFLAKSTGQFEIISSNALCHSTLKRLQKNFLFFLLSHGKKLKTPV
jgi:hypothetical protein